MGHHMTGASIKAAITSESAAYARSEVREVIDGERNDALCQILDDAGEVVTRVTAKRAGDVLTVELFGYDRRGDAIRAATGFFGRPVFFVRDTSTYDEFLPSCAVRLGEWRWYLVAESDGAAASLHTFADRETAERYGAVAIGEACRVERTSSDAYPYEAATVTRID